MPSARIHEFIRYCLVGLVGVGVDAGMLELLVGAGIAPLPARVVSMLVALLTTYLLHGRFTYRMERLASARRWLKFMASNLLGAAINYGIFALVLLTLPLADARATRLVALAAGTGIALGFNFWANRRFAFAPAGR